MIACGIFLMVAVVLWIIGRKKLSMEKKKMLGIVALAAVLGLLTGMVNDAAEFANKVRRVSKET